MRSGIVALVVLLTGCPEYSFPEAPRGWEGEPNPAVLTDPVQTDRLVQVVDPIVDILWIVDNSKSMANDREKLAANFPLFMQWFEESGVDYHIGVTTTDMTDPEFQGRLREVAGIRWITPDTPHAMRRFSAMATELKAGSAYEKGREAAYNALEVHRDGFNEGFLREGDGGWLHITVVSDEDDDTDKDVISKKEFAAYIDGLKAQHHRTTFNSIVNLYNRGLTEERGTKYLWLTDEIGGVEHDIKTGDWSVILDDLGGLQTVQPTDEFFLSRVPVPDTIDVKVVHDDITFVYAQEVDYTWSQTRNSVTFVDEADMPAPGAEIFVTYTVAASQVSLEDDGGGLLLLED